ncbi:hypothetical protein ACNKHR_11650 [Shigella flexneri]
MNVFENIEMPLVWCFHALNVTGEDPSEALHINSQELTLRLAELEKKAHGIPGDDLTFLPPSSYKPFSSKNRALNREENAGGAPSTSEEVLEELALDYPLPKVIGVSWLAEPKSTYTESCRHD